MFSMFMAYIISHLDHKLPEGNGLILLYFESLMQPTQQAHPLHFTFTNEWISEWIDSSQWHMMDCGVRGLAEFQNFFKFKW